MLVCLDIKNAALIEHLSFDIKNGMTVLTGETGAGKSVIIDSINLIMGARAGRTIVRYGESKASVQAVFETKDLSSFEKFGITSFGERGEDFNPEIHNAVMTTDDAELESGKIAMVLQRGYRIGDKIIRHALVGVTN